MLEVIASIVIFSLVTGSVVIGKRSHDEKKTKELEESIPCAAHNRSVNWYQELQRMPVEEYAIEVKKWREFTKSLPTTKRPF